MALEKRVGCWFSQKKRKKLSVEKLRTIFRKHGIELTEIDLERSLDEQGPFDAIIHKLTDLILESRAGNQKATKNLHDFQNYLARNPNTLVFDPLKSIEKLLNRYETYSMIKQTKMCSNGLLHIPTFTLILSRDKDEILKQMKEENVNFPIMCKKNVSHGSASHKMSIIFDEEGLKDVDPPCVAQTFIDHSALLYKIYVIADNYHMVERPSLKNFGKKKWEGHKTIFFNSHDISSGDSMRSELNTLASTEEDPRPVDKNIVNSFTAQLHKEIKMSMYGIDIIVCSESGKHYVIDVNVFPGYDGVDNYLEILANTIMKSIPQPVYCNGSGDANAIENGLKQNGTKLSNGILNGDCINVS